MKLFPVEIQDFAFQFQTFQVKRHDADYNPTGDFSKSSVEAGILIVEQAIASFKSAPVEDRTAFCVWVLFEKPRVDKIPSR